MRILLLACLLLPLSVRAQPGDPYVPPIEPEQCPSLSEVMEAVQSRRVIESPEWLIDSTCFFQLLQEAHAQPEQLSFHNQKGEDIVFLPNSRVSFVPPGTHEYAYGSRWALWPSVDFAKTYQQFQSGKLGCWDRDFLGWYSLTFQDCRERQMTPKP